MKKKVIFITSIAGNDFSHRPGETALIDAKLADAWSASGICQIAADDPEELKAKIAELQKQLKESEKSAAK